MLRSIIAICQRGAESVSLRWLICLPVFIALPAVAATSAPLAWDANPDANVAGYKIYYGAASRTYTASVDVGNVTNAVITGLAEGATYYFAATTYDAAGVESDFSNEAIRTFTVNVADVNQPPTLDPVANLTLNYNSPAQTIGLSGIGSGAANEIQALTVTAVSSNKKLIPNPVVNYSSPLATGSLTLTPAASASGSATITVTVNDGGATNNLITRTFTVTVRSKAATSSLRLRLSKLPKSQVVLAGKSATFSVAASGSGILKYQWKYNGKNIIGATKATLTLKNCSAQQAGLYTVTVSNNGGAVASAPAALQVVDTPAAVLTSAVKANGQFAFDVEGLTDCKYAVQASTDLVHWTSVQTNTAPFSFTDPNAGQVARQFYRTVYVP